MEHLFLFEYMHLGGVQHIINEKQRMLTSKPVTIGALIVKRPLICMRAPSHFQLNFPQGASAKERGNRKGTWPISSNLDLKLGH